MKYLLIPPSGPRRLPFYLAVEEWAARTLPPDDYFFAWRVAPTVICGRNQDLEREVDLDFCRRQGIDVVRRRSGGGAVLADMDNLMFSYITPGDEITATFSRYTTLIASMLRSLGIRAEATGRNDIVVDSRKVAGNAFYHLPGRCIVHGTMLIDFNPALMAAALTPSRAKMESKAVVSVPSRVTGLRAEGLAMTPQELADYARRTLCEGEYRLTAADIAEVERIEQAYYSPAFLRGRHAAERKGRPQTAVRIEGVGEFTANLTTDASGRISAVNLSGDFFVTGDLHSNITAHLIGVRPRPDSLAEALRASTPGKAVPGLTREHVLQILTPSIP